MYMVSVSRSDGIFGAISAELNTHAAPDPVVRKVRGSEPVTVSALLLLLPEGGDLRGKCEIWDPALCLCC